MADQFNLLDLKQGSTKNVGPTVVLTLPGTISTLVSPANPNKTKVLIQAGVSGINYSVQPDGLLRGILITSSAGSVYPIQVEIETSADIFVANPIAGPGSVQVLEFFN